MTLQSAVAQRDLLLKQIAEVESLPYGSAERAAAFDAQDAWRAEVRHLTDWINERASENETLLRQALVALHRLELEVDFSYEETALVVRLEQRFARNEAEP